ncbi:hypothetical protein EXS57_03125, partial [Candidatus Kaiserbacteria bacterium]|nr:hypothetical protein [Candidatus Kaiserbacteria bacterium]
MDPFSNEKLITTKHAGELSGYTSDYVSRLLRSGKITGKRIGRNWLVEKESFTNFLKAQGNHNVDRARTLASERAREYRVNRSFLHRATKSLTESLPVLKSSDAEESSLPLRTLTNLSMKGAGSSVFALMSALLVLTGSALAAHTSVIPATATQIANIAEEVSLGFNETFGDLQSRIAAKIDEVGTSAHEVSLHVAAKNETASAGLALVVFEKTDLAFLQRALVIDQQQHVASNRGMTVLEPSATTASLLTVDDIGSLGRNVYTLLSSPSRVARAIVDTYSAVGESAYAAIDSSFTAYDSLIKKLGAQTLALAATTRDALAHAPRFVSEINLAFGKAIVDTTHAAIQVEVDLVYETGVVAPASARAITLFVGTVGDTLERAATHPPVYIAQAVRTFGEAGYENMKYLGNLAFVSAPMFTDIPTALENAYLGALGSSSLALENTGKEIERAFSTITRGLQSNPQIAAVLLAAEPVLAPSERAALAIYETVHALFQSATNTLALIIAPAPIIVMPNVGSLSAQSLARVTPLESSTSTSYSLLATNPSPSYTVFVQGVSTDSVEKSLAALRVDILGTVTSMIQPVSNQIATNASTIQQVNMIQDIANLIVRNGDFRGGSFTTLTGDTVNLNDATVLNSLTVNGSFSSYVSTIAPFFTATST